MKRFLMMCFIQVISCCVFAQNLVPNPSFENHNVCPYSFNNNFSYQVYNNFPTVTDWIRPILTTPDYYNVCGTSGFGVPYNKLGYQPARSGNAYVGIFIICVVNNNRNYNWCEYVTARLLTPLQAGHEYSVSFYVNAPNLPMGAGGDGAVITDQIGAVLSDTIVTLTQGSGSGIHIPLRPSIANVSGNYITDTVNWVKIQGIYTAHGGEQWITLGNMYDTVAHWLRTALYNPGSGALQNGCYVFIDDVCVTDINSAVTSNKDTTICTRTGLYTLGVKHIDGNTYHWNTGDSTETIVIKDSGTYWIRTIGECIVYVDTIRMHFKTIPTKLDLGRDSTYCYGQKVTINTNDVFDSYSWNTGATTPSIEVTKGGRYILSVTDACGIQNDTINVFYTQPLAKLNIDDTSICQYSLSPKLNIVGDSIKWYTSLYGAASLTQPLVNTDTPGMQTFYITSYNYCSESDKVPMHLNVIALPSISLPEDTTICVGSEILLTPISINPKSDIRFKWNVGDSTCCIDVASSNKYILMIINSCGISEDSINVNSIDCDSCLWVPSAFTPNNDGKNDIFRVVNVNHCPLSDYHIVIADRWGRIVFENESMDDKWDGTYNGTPSDIGTYFYVLQIRTSGNHIIHKKGDITLIR